MEKSAPKFNAMEISASKFDFVESLPTASAWPARVVLLGFALFTAVCLLVGAGDFLRLAFPAGAVVVGAYLYWKQPAHYVGFVWWLWMLTPLVRRLVDLQSGWVNPNPVLLAPPVVTFISGLTFVRYLATSGRAAGLPFVVVVAGVGYGLGIGILRTLAPAEMLVPTLTWLAPLFFAFHLCHHWRLYPLYQRVIRQTFFWGLLLAGWYGVVQYFVLPAWDGFWLQNVEIGAFGGAKAERLSVRVFSTMHSPGPFAVTMMAGLLLLFSTNSVLRLPAAIGGYLSILLSSVRATWLGWGVGMLTLFSTFTMRARLRLLLVLAALALCLTPLVMYKPIADRVLQRFDTFSQLENDVSLAARLEGYQRYVIDALEDPFGKGIGAMEREYAIDPDSDEMGPHDSALLEILLSLGWVGSLCYCAGLALLLWRIRPRAATRADHFAAAAHAIAWGCVAQMVLGSVTIGVQGMVFWSFPGLVLAAQQYHAAQVSELS